MTEDFSPRNLVQGRDGEQPPQFVGHVIVWNDRETIGALAAKVETIAFSPAQSNLSATSGYLKTTQRVMQDAMRKVR